MVIRYRPGSYGNRNALPGMPVRTGRDAGRGGYGARAGCRCADGEDCGGLGHGSSVERGNSSACNCAFRGKMCSLKSKNPFAKQILHGFLPVAGTE